MRKRYVGIDVGERRLFAAVIETEADSANISFCPETEPTAVLDWCTKSTPQSVAIDAPPAHSKGLAKVGSRRVAEERLGIGGCYGTPQLGSPLPPWMATGMRFHASVNVALGETVIDLGGTGTVFEVHPTYGFRSLLGVDTDRERVRCDPDAFLRPKAPRGSVGHVQRVAVLRLLLERFGVTWTQEISEKLLSRLDWTDAAISAALAILRARDATLGIGDPNEGVIVIADPLKLGRLVPRIREVVSGVSARSPRSAGNGARRSTVPDDSDCALLRLGSSGLGLLSQEDTLSALRGQHSEGQILFPVGVNALGRQWIDRAAMGGFWLLIAYGRLKVALRVVEIVGNGRAKLTPKEVVLGAIRDPWPSVEQSEYWLRCEEMLDNLDLPATAVSTRQGGTWTLGVPRNQTAWLTARVDDKGLRGQLRPRDASR
jgi:hypothetical protein